MLTFLQKYWPLCRLIGYGILAALLGAASFVGWITADQAADWLKSGATTLGMVGFIVAGLYVDTTGTTKLRPETLQAIEAAIAAAQAPSAAINTAQQVGEQIGTALRIPNLGESVRAAVEPARTDLEAMMQDTVNRGTAAIDDLRAALSRQLGGR
ncbi:hypothetical protein [Rhodococcus sp. NPDC003348]